METTDKPMPEEFYTEEDCGMFSSALKAHLEQMDEYAKDLAMYSAKLEAAVASGDLIQCEVVAPLIFEACSCLHHSVIDASSVFSQDDLWALGLADSKLRQHSLAVFEAAEGEVGQR